VSSIEEFEMTAIRSVRPIAPMPRTQVVAKAAPAAPAAKMAPKAPIQAKGAVETGSKVIGGIAGTVAGVMGGTAVGLLGYVFLGAAGHPVEAVIGLSALGFGALGGWAGVKNGKAIGELIEGFFH
jgi:hypothetical protein